MDIALEKASETNASLKIKVIPADYKAEVSKKLRETGQRVALKGFRPGKVPTSLVQKMYGKGILIDEINNLLSKSVSGYIRENKLQVVGDPIPNREEGDAIDWDTQEEFEFTYELGLASDFSLDLAGLPTVNQYEIQAGDAEVDETITNLRQQFHGHEQADTAIEDDTLDGELKQVTGEANAEAGAIFSTKTAVPLKKMAEDVRGLFDGQRVGDTVTFDIAVAFPDEKDRALVTGVKREEAANLTGDFAFTLESITRHVPAELNQAFFDKVLGIGAVENEEQFREKVRDIITGNYVRESASLLRYDIEKSLLENTPILLPDEFLKNWLVETNEGKFTREQIEEQYEDFTKSVKLQLIKNKMAENADIKVEFAEVMVVARQMVQEQFGFAAGGGNPEMDETIDRIARNYLMDEKNNGQNYTSLYNRVFDDKIIDYAKTQLTVNPQTVSVDEFKAIAEKR
ncbi:MAG: trigger factor [Bacteroidetes bacterium]|nr:trigger factor [Fibrella sp.]